MSVWKCAVVLLAGAMPLALGQIIFHSSGPALTAPASSVPPEQRCVVSGTVLNRMTGETLRKVQVRLTAQGNSAGPAMAGGRPNATGYSTLSEADGSFRIDDVVPGEYQLEGQRSGYLQTQYGAKGWNRPGVKFSLRASQHMESLVLQMNPQGVITGKVVDTDGDAVEGVTVSVLRQSWFEGRYRFQPVGFQQSNDLGEFRISGLSPGRYHLVAEPQDGMRAHEEAPANGKPDVRETKTYYPDAAEIETATAIHIEPGQNATGMDIRLRKSVTYHVRGHVGGVLPVGSELNRLSVQLTKKDGKSFFIGGNSASVGKNHSFDIAGVTPGSYDVAAVDTHGRFRLLATQPVQVSEGDVNDVALMIVQPGTLHGQIRLEGQPAASTSPADLSAVRLFLSNSEMRFSSADYKVAESGSFTFEDVALGKYQLRCFSPPPHSYLASVRRGQQEVNGKEIDLSQGVSGELEVIFRFDMAEVTGTVQMESTENNSVSRPALVVLVPSDSLMPREWMRTGSTAQDGSFDIKDIPPGSYRAFAFEEVDVNNLQNPDLQKQIEGMGKEVTLKEADRPQIQLTMVPAGGMQQIYARIGLDNE